MFRWGSLGTIIVCAFAIVGPVFIAAPAMAAGKKTPQEFTLSEFKSIVQQSLGKESSAFGAAGDARGGSIAGKKGYFFTFANATVGVVGKAVPTIVVDKTDPNKGVSVAEFIQRDSDEPKCKLSGKDDISASTPDKVTLSATSAVCMKEGKEVYEGFVKFIDERASADFLFWVYGKNVPDAAARVVRDRILERIKKDYAS